MLDPARPRLRERGERAAVGLPGERSSPLESELAHVGAFTQPLIAALLLPQRFLGAGYVEYVVHYLEKYPQLPREASEAVNSLRFIESGQEEHALDARGDQSAGLELVQAP